MGRFLGRTVLACAALWASSISFAQGISFSPASLDFGVLPPKSKKELKIQVTPPAGVGCALTKPPRFTVTPDKFSGATGPVTLTVEFDNSSMVQQGQEVTSQGFVAVKCGSVSANFNVKGGLQPGAPRPAVQLTQKGQPDGTISFTVQGDPQNPKPVCGLTGGGGGAFGSTGASGFSCGDQLHIGSVARFEILNSTRFLKFTGGTGSASACNELTSKVCSFTVGPAGGSIVAEYQPPPSKFRVRLKHDGDGVGKAEGTTRPDNNKVVSLVEHDKGQTGVFDSVPNLKLSLKAAAAPGSVFTGFEVKKPAGVTCPRKGDECTLDLNPATLEYEIEVNFKKGASGKGSS